MRATCSYRKRLYWAWVPLVVLLTTGASAPRPKEKEAELKDVQARIEKIRKDIHDDALRRDLLATELKDAEMNIQTARARVAQLQADRADAEQSLANLTAQRGATERQVAHERAALGQELRVAYMSGRSEQLRLLLNQEDPATLGRMVTYHGYLGRARAQRFERVRDGLLH